MNEFYTFFAQAYWWLSLLGGLHCLTLAIYIRFFLPCRRQSTTPRELFKPYRALLPHWYAQSR